MLQFLLLLAPALASAATTHVVMRREPVDACSEQARCLNVQATCTAGSAGLPEKVTFFSVSMPQLATVLGKLCSMYNIHLLRSIIVLIECDYS